MPTTPIRSAVVFCGSRVGHDPEWRDAAMALGHGMAASGIRLIYGGGRIGLMGAVADAALAGGGQVTGIIPAFLQAREISHAGVADLIVTYSMHDRKRQMAEQADAFITMPGGLGTLDETIEIITWRQLDLHDKPILICNVNGWATALLAAVSSVIDSGFADAGTRALFEVVPDVPSLLSRLQDLSATAARPIGSRL